MRLGLSQSLRLEQRLVQSPQMIQAMQILQLPTLDLAARIEKELEENPFLEMNETPPSTGSESANGSAGPTSSAEASVLNTLDQLEKQSRDSQSFRRKRNDAEASERQYEALQNAPEKRNELRESLLAQMHMLDLSDSQREIGEYLIYSLDSRGYLIDPPEALASSMGMQYQAEEVQAMIEKLREIGPPGIAARDLQECLLLQIKRIPDAHPLARSLVENHLSDIESNRMPKIAKDLGRSIPEIKSAIEFLRTLDPRPGGDLSDEHNAIIRPDVVVEEIDGKWELRFERGALPELQISPTYREMLAQVKKDPKIFEFLKKRIESAKFFIDAIQQRQSTIELICREIVRRQKDFFHKGVEGLKPLRMQEVADTVGVHISTVSRAISGKYIQTPQGIFELKFFFTGGTLNQSGEVESQTAIKEKISEIVVHEDRRHPLSDDEIAKILHEKNGLPIARRTVTKYRKALKIPPSNLRRQY